MTDPRGSPSTILDVNPALPPLSAETARPVAVQPSSRSEYVGAQWRLSARTGTDARQQRITRGYSGIVEALGLAPDQNPGAFYDIGGSRNPILSHSDLLPERGFGSRMTDRSMQEALIAREIRRRRARDPNFLPGVPDDVAELHQYFLRQDIAERQRDQAVVANGPGDLLSNVLGFGASVGGTMRDPVNVATLPIGGGGRTLFQVAAREAIVGFVTEAVQQPIQYQVHQELGETLTAGDMLRSSLYAGVGSAALGGGFWLGGRGAVRAYDATVEQIFNVLPESVQQSWAARMTVGDRQMPIGDYIDSLGNRDAAELVRDVAAGRGVAFTPEEQAAINVVEREGEIAEVSPFIGGLDGDEAHASRLSAALRALVNDRPLPAAPPPPVTRGTLPSPAPSRPPPARSAAPAAAPDFDRQWTAIIGIEGGTDRQGRFRTSPAGAIGPAQVMPGTAPEAARLAGLPFDNHRYRTDAAYNIALGQAYYREMLRQFGGDPSKAAAAYNAGPGSARRGTGVRGAMARAERAGEPDNWEAYLPRETRLYVQNFRRRTGAADSGAGTAAPAGAAEAGPDFAAAARAAEQEVDGLIGGTVEDAASPAPARAEVLFEPVPELRRDMFGSDADWQAAQLRLYREMNDEGEFAPPGAGYGPQAREAGTARSEGPSTGEGAVRASERLEEPNAAPEPPVVSERTGASRPRGRRSLLQFIADGGGIVDVDGDLKAMGLASRRGRARKGERKLIVPASDAAGLFGRGGGNENMPDAWAMRAWERGYFPNLPERPTVDELYAAIGDELQGRPIYTPEDQADLDALAAARARHAENDEIVQRIESEAEERGIELDADTLEDAIERTLASGSPERALDDAIRAAAFVDAERLAMETGDFPYAIDDAGRRWDDHDVNWNDPGADGAADRQAGPGGGRSAGERGDAAPGGAVRAQPPGAAERASLEPFADPEGAGVRAQTDSLDHDLRASLDRGAEADPALAERQRQEVELRAKGPLRPGAVDQKGEMGLGLFDAADQPGFRLDEDGDEKALRDIFDEIDAEEQAAKNLRDCL